MFQLILQEELVLCGTKDWFKAELGREVDAAYLDGIQEMDRPENLGELAELGRAVAGQVRSERLPAAFDRGVRLDETPADGPA